MVGRVKLSLAAREEIGATRFTQPVMSLAEKQQLAEKHGVSVNTVGSIRAQFASRNGLTAAQTGRPRSLTRPEEDELLALADLRRTLTDKALARRFNLPNEHAVQWLLRRLRDERHGLSGSNASERR